jgi:hypothetical protein
MINVYLLKVGGEKIIWCRVHLMKVMIYETLDIIKNEEITYIYFSKVEWIGYVML